MKNARYFFIIFCIVSSPCFLRGEQAKRVSVGDDTLSVNVRNAPLFDVLKEIGDRTGMEVKVDPEVNKNVTASFDNLPIKRGIARLIHPLDYVMKWKRTTSGEETVEKITAVEIFKKGERGRAEKVLSSSHSSSGMENSKRQGPPRGESREPGAQPRRPRRERPRTRYKGTKGGSYTNRIRAKKLYVAPDTGYYDELSP
ncbi:MAG: hypothetical protein P9M00_12875 [Candidatus Tritonobacter lacicola]|nr:hypothetical protein [Candidatus Tritonobacter lacicola]